MNCTICNKEIELHPSARQRAAEDVTGKTAAYYTGLFKMHTKCALQKREADTLKLMRSKHE